MSEKITDRLRCRYAMGPFMPNGEPEFGWRDFSGPAIEGMTLPTPIMLEAAKAIDAKDAEIARLREALQREADWHEGETKAHRTLAKSSTGVYHGLKVEWHKERAEQIRAALTQQEQV